MVTEFSPEAIDCVGNVLLGLNNFWSQYAMADLQEDEREIWGQRASAVLSALVEGGHVVPADEDRVGAFAALIGEVQRREKAEMRAEAAERRWAEAERQYKSFRGWAEDYRNQRDIAEARVDRLTQATDDLLDAYHPGLMREVATTTGRHVCAACSHAWPCPGERARAALSGRETT